MAKPHSVVHFTLSASVGVALLLATACGSMQTPAASLASGTVGRGGEVAAEQATGFPNFDVIQVSGIGKKTEVPDVATLSLDVEVVADTVAQAKDLADTTLKAVIDAIKAEGVDDDDIVTSHLRFRPKYDYSPEEGEELVGYRVDNGLRVTVTDDNPETAVDAEKVNRIINAVVANGGDYIVFNSLRFSFSDDKAKGLEEDARTAAVFDLRKRAEQLAEAAGRELGDLKLLTEGVGGFGGGGIFQEAALFALDSAASYGLDTPITAGEGEVTVVVFGIYELLPSLEEETEASAGSQ
jgi:uncharacterized protein YggE